MALVDDFMSQVVDLNEKEKEEKLEQLRKVFKRLMENFIDDHEPNDELDEFVDSLVYEVKVRIDNK